MFKKTKIHSRKNKVLSQHGNNKDLFVHKTLD